MGDGGLKGLSFEVESMARIKPDEAGNVLSISASVVFLLLLRLKRLKEGMREDAALDFIVAGVEVRLGKIDVWKLEDESIIKGILV